MVGDAGCVRARVYALVLFLAVARDLRVSVARLLKKCREFGILRWPYRHVSTSHKMGDRWSVRVRGAGGRINWCDCKLCTFINMCVSVQTYQHERVNKEYAIDTHR